MKLHELLNRKVDYKVLTKTGREFSTGAKIGDRDIVFTALYASDGNYWNVEFEEFSKDAEHGTYDQTGSGNELEVFAMVKDSMLEFVKEYEPSEIYFSASKKDDKDNRADVYEKMVKRFKVPGYTMTRANKSIGAAKYTEFALIKDNK